MLSVHPTLVTFASFDTRKLFLLSTRLYRSSPTRPPSHNLPTTSILLHDIRILYLARLIIILTRWEKNSSKMADVNMSSAPAQRSSKFFLFLIHLKADFREDVMGEKAFSKRK